MNKVVNMFEHQVDVHKESAVQLLQEMGAVADDFDKAVVVLIKDRAGVWETVWKSCQMTNSEVSLSLDITKRLLMDSMLS